MEKLIVRFAPSPTGMLHIGGARTGLFNFLFAKKHNAKFILRIEDTDRERSTSAAMDAIINGLKTLKIDYDEKHLQSERINRHKEVALDLVAKGFAYFDRKEGEELAPVRIKVPKNKEVCFEDTIRGKISFNSNDLEEFVLLRSDGTPTYMLSVVVDDIDMEISDIIRGDDHIGNTPKQILLYEAIGAKIPRFAHLPLIHDADGQKLSKRKSAAAVEDYLNLGYLPEAIANYLLHLGGGYSKDIVSREEAIDMFDLKKIGKSPSRLDFDRLNFINLHYIKNEPEDSLLELIFTRLESDIGIALNTEDKHSIKVLLPELRKINNLNEIAEVAITVTSHFDFNIHKKDILEVDEESGIFIGIIKNKTAEEIRDVVNNMADFCKQHNIPQKVVYQVVRFILIGRLHSVSVKLLLLAISNKEIERRVTGFLLLQNS